MSKITKIQFNAEKERYYVYIDNQYCTSIRERTFSAMNIKNGDVITCAALKEKESHHWKHTYNQDAWDKEKIRLNKVINLIEGINKNIKTKIIGFGADSNEFIPGHPAIAGKPDLEVINSQTNETLMLVEVTGTERMRGSSYWIRPDKIKYAQDNPSQNVWIILHYQQPHELFVYIKPNPHKIYDFKKIDIRGSLEHYVEFNDSSDEVRKFSEFKKQLDN